MEVASPLPFPHSQGGTKRPFACNSPILDVPMDARIPTTTDDNSMDDSPGFGHQSKRRRRYSSDRLDAGSSPFASNAPSFFSSASPFSQPLAGSKSFGGTSLKRTRTESSGEGKGWNKALAQQKIAEELQRVVDQQAAEIERLKSEKEAASSSLSELTTSHEKALNENKILKKAVTIQQERQNQTASELEEARKFKVDAEDRIRKLEQMNLTLSYHLQAQNPSSGNDFMGFSPRPPDVY